MTGLGRTDVGLVFGDIKFGRIEIFDYYVFFLFASSGSLMLMNVG